MVMANPKRTVLFTVVLICSCFRPTDGDGKRRISLPEIIISEERGVDNAIFRRRSVRQFVKDPLTIEQISTLFWAAGGATVDGVTGATRAYPSAGGLYPLHFYVVVSGVEGLDNDVYKYDWKNHSVMSKNLGDRMGAVKEVTYSNSFLKQDVSAVFVITADYSITTERYSRRGEKRYVPMEAGASSQNLALKAEALGLGCYVIGAFEDWALSSALDLDKEETPLLILPVGNAR